MPPPSARLDSLTELVLPGRPMADIGTDHARVPTALISAGTVPLAIGIDLRAGPLTGARATLAAAGLVGDARIELRQGDGLAPLRPGEVATVVIAGMGGARILALLQAAPGVLATVERLVLQPNTEIPAVRGGLAALGFRIVDERLVLERGQAHTLIAAEPGQAPLDDAERLLGPVLLRRRDPAFLCWLSREERRLAHASKAAAGSSAGRNLAHQLDLVRQAVNRCPPVR